MSGAVPGCLVKNDAQIARESFKPPTASRTLRRALVPGRKPTKRSPAGGGGGGSSDTFSQHENGMVPTHFVQPEKGMAPTHFLNLKKVSQNYHNGIYRGFIIIINMHG